MGVDELSRGMLGVGRTVFQGTRIDSFQVEILGVLRNAFGPKTDIILVRLSGHPLEKTGGIAGMSGSPVYVDDRLIGAVAYGWSFSTEPIMGITPIGEMLDILERPNTHLSDATAPSGRAFDDLTDEVTVDTFGSEASLTPGQIQRVKTPVYLSGFATEVVPQLQDQLSAFGLFPVQGGGGTDATLGEPTLEPGAALGVQLVRGDFNMTAIGTLTHVDGDRLIGFGHPMLSSGSTRLPMTTAYIHDVIPSRFLSFKLGSAVKQVGAITQDRAPGIAGLIGAKAEMMPTTVRVSSPGRSEQFEMEVLRNRDLGPLLIQSAVISSLISAEKARGEVTVKTRLQLKIADRETLVFDNIFAGPRGLGEGVMGVTRPLQLLLQNPFEAVRVESASFDLEVAEEVEAARIEAVQVDRSRFEAGDVVGLEIDLRPYLAPTRTVKASVTIPDHIREGTVLLRVSSARAYAAQNAKRVPDTYRVSDVEGLIDALEREYRNDDLIVELLANRAGATVNGVELSSLPPSVAAAMKTSRRSGGVRAVNQTVVSKQVLKTEHVLSGQQTVFLAVGSDGPSLRFSPGQPARPTPKKD